MVVVLRQLVLLSTGWSWWKQVGPVRLYLAGEAWPPKQTACNTYPAWQRFCLKNRRDRDREGSVLVLVVA